MSNNSGKKASLSSYSKPPTPQREDSIYRRSQQLLTEVTENNLKQAQILLQHDVNLMGIKDNNNQNLLHLAASNNNSFLFECILRKQQQYLSYHESFDPQFIAWINEADIDGFTPGHLAAHRGNVAIIKLFIERGGDIQVKSHKGLTLFHVAAQNNQSIMLAYLKEYCHFQPNILDVKGGNALHQSCYFGCEDAVNILLSWKLEINQQDADGLTPLHLAIIGGHLKIVKKMLHRGAKKSIKDRNNHNAFEIAEQFNQFQILEYLKENKGNIKQICCQMQYKQCITHLFYSCFRQTFYLVFYYLSFFVFFGHRYQLSISISLR